MRKGKKRKYLYGKVHHIKFPYKMRIFGICDEYRGKANQLFSDYRINNLIVDLRNELIGVIDEIYQRLKVEIKQGVVISPSKRKVKFKPRSEILSGRRCEICKEDRTVDACHIIPREEGGSNAEENYLFLCPTHHYLFDESKLSKEKFNKISVTNKDSDSVEYFQKVRKKKHEVYWKYGISKFKGCDCRSTDFEVYNTSHPKRLLIPNGETIPAKELKCKECGKWWAQYYSNWFPKYVKDRGKI